MKNELIFQLFSFQAYDPEQMPTSLSDLGPERQVPCIRCGRILTERDLTQSELLFRTRQPRIPEYWLDIAATGIFHERVVEALEKEGATGFRAHPMSWAGYDEWLDVAGPKARALKLPAYYRIEVLGRVDVDLEILGGKRCTACGNFFPGEKLEFGQKRRVPVPGTWDESDFCTWRNLDTGSALCSRRIVDLAAKYRWSGIFGHFVPGVAICSPVPPNWFEIYAPKIAERYADLL